MDAISSPRLASPTPEPVPLPLSLPVTSPRGGWADFAATARFSAAVPCHPGAFLTKAVIADQSLVFVACSPGADWTASPGVVLYSARSSDVHSIPQAEALQSARLAPLPGTRCPDHVVV